MLSKQELIDFEADIAREFEAGHIHAPVHLHGGQAMWKGYPKDFKSQEDELIEIFKEVMHSDYVFSTHRSHYHALLKGVPPKLVKAEIMAGHSISLQFPEYHFFTSAIVGGIIPIALGVAMTGRKCWVFYGDMASHTGIVYECRRYAGHHDLPIVFVCEDNGYSVDTPTEAVYPRMWEMDERTIYYKRKYPHQGTGVNVIF